jgi:hypothetical protein
MNRFLKKNFSILFALMIFAGLSCYASTAQAQDAPAIKGQIILPNGAYMSAEAVGLAFELGEIDHAAATTAIGMLGCMEQALEGEADWTWEECRDEGLEKLFGLLERHKEADAKLQRLMTAKRS